MCCGLSKAIRISLEILPPKKEDSPFVLVSARSASSLPSFHLGNTDLREPHRTRLLRQQVQRAVGPAQQHGVVLPRRAHHERRQSVKQGRARVTVVPSPQTPRECQHTRTSHRSGFRPQGDVVPLGRRKACVVDGERQMEAGAWPSARLSFY